MVGTVITVAAGSVLFGFAAIGMAESGRLLQGAGSAFAFTGAVYLAVHGSSARWLAAAIGFTQLAGCSSAFLAPVFGLALMRLSGGHALTLANFQEADLIWAGAIVLSLILTFFLRETGIGARQGDRHAGRQHILAGGQDRT